MPFRRNFWAAMGVAIVVVLVFFAVYVIVNPNNGVKQAINMHKAQRHIDAHSASLLATPERSNITLHVYTGGSGSGGCIQVRGVCPSIEAAMALRTDIEATHPPVEVMFNLEKLDERCAQLDFITGDHRSKKPDIVMSNNFAFGGINTSLIFKKV